MAAYDRSEPIIQTRKELDTLGFEPRAFRMRSGCDTTTPCTRYTACTWPHTFGPASRVRDIPARTVVRTQVLRNLRDGVPRRRVCSVAIGTLVGAGVRGPQPRVCQPCTALSHSEAGCALAKPTAGVRSHRRRSAWRPRLQWLQIWPWSLAKPPPTPAAAPS